MYDSNDGMVAFTLKIKIKLMGFCPLQATILDFRKRQLRRRNFFSKCLTTV